MYGTGDKAITGNQGLKVTAHKTEIVVMCTCRDLYEIKINVTFYSVIYLFSSYIIDRIRYYLYNGFIPILKTLAGILVE